MAISLEQRLQRMEGLLEQLVTGMRNKDWYSVAEVAVLVDRSEYQVRQWCKSGKIRAEKSGRRSGRFQTWVVSREELLRYERNGLLPARAA
jgi:hypothetical protein